VSRHWQPERPGWTVIEGYGSARERRSFRIAAAMIVTGAVLAGVAVGAAWQRSPGPRPLDASPSSAIEWNAVQAVPARAPDAEDAEWEKRAQEQDRPSTSPDQVRGFGGRTEVDNAAIGGQAPPGLVTGKIYVIDGDTFGIGSERIRIAGMDAPETHPPRCTQEAQLGLAATAKLKELLGSGTVMMSGSGHDKYGRELRQVSVNGVDVAQTMIAAGLASSYSGGKRQSWC